MRISKKNLLALSAALIYVCATTLTFSASEKPEPEHRLAGLVEMGQMYASLDTLHLKTEFHMSGTDSEGNEIEGVGSYEFWRSGNAYRVHSYSDPSLGLQSDLEMVFDGTTAYYFVPDLSLVEIRSGDYEHQPTALPNPMTLPFSFLPDKPGCKGCRLELADLQKDGLWRDFLSRTKVDIRKSGPSLVRFTEFRKGASRSSAVKLGRVEGQKVPTHLTHTVGSQIFEFEFADYFVLKTDRSVAPVPRTIRFSVRGDGKSQTEEIQARFEITELATKLDPSVFGFDLDRAERIWDRSLDMFLD